MTYGTSVDGTKGGPAFLGIDLGTSSVKAVIVDLDGAVLGQAGCGYAVKSPRPGWSETDPQEWLQSTIAAVRTAVAGAGADVVAIGFSGQMHGIVVADASGVPLRPAMLWSDARATAQLNSYRAMPARIRVRLANPLSPGMAGPLLSWLHQHDFATYAAASWVLSPKDWLRAQLTGLFHAEPSDASATLLYDLARDCWDLEVLDALQVDVGKLPPLLPGAGHVAGELTAAGAELLGLRAGIPVAAGAGDTAAAALGSRLVDSEVAQLTIGTGAQVIRPVAQFPEDLTPAPVTHLYRAATDTGWYRMAASLNAGSTLTWVCTLLGASWPELYECAGLSPDDDAPLFLPHLHGERTPYLDPDMRGAWTGLAPRHRRADLLSAALEGVAFAVRDAADALLPDRHSLKELRLAGGGTTSPAWRQMLADILEFPLTPIDIAAASGLGAAALARQAAGMATGSPRDRQMPSQPTIYPDAARSRVYRARYALYRQRVASLRFSTVLPDAPCPAGFGLTRRTEGRPA